MCHAFGDSLPRRHFSKRPKCDFGLPEAARHSTGADTTPFSGAMDAQRSSARFEITDEGQTASSAASTSALRAGARARRGSRSSAEWITPRYWSTVLITAT
jgi:hypothetical protein